MFVLHADNFFQFFCVLFFICYYFTLLLLRWFWRYILYSTYSNDRHNENNDLKKNQPIEVLIANIFSVIKYTTVEKIK